MVGNIVFHSLFSVHDTFPKRRARNTVCGYACSYPCLFPVTSSKINRHARPHVVHDLLNAPWLVFVALRVVRLKFVFILHVNALLQRLRTLLVVLIYVGLGVVRPNPFGQFGSSATGIKLDLVPVGVLEKFSVGEAELLGTGVADKAIGLP